MCAHADDAMAALNRSSYFSCWVQAHRMIDAGADVIFGSHSHRVQPMETYRGRPARQE